VTRPRAALLVGRVMHERLWPFAHRFVYPVFLLRLPLSDPHTADGLSFGVDRRRPLSLRLRDYGPRNGGDLLDWIRGLLRDAGLDASGEVYLQTMPRILGYAFNPISCWYCHDAEGRLRAILAEVNSTFGEHHSYLLGAPDGGAITAGTVLTARKRMHVSPFCEVTGDYRFRVAERHGHSVLAIDYHDGTRLVLRTAVGGRLVPARGAALWAAFVRQPLLTVGVTVKIHWQALRLWLRRLPVHAKPPHPPEPFSLGTPR
jgi:uncharacterized protein